MSKSDKVIAAFQAIASVIWAATALLAPWLVVLSPAVFFGWTTYQTAIRTGMPSMLAISVGLAAAVGLETVNIAAAHAALQLSHEREQHAGKFILACGLVGFYVILGLVGMAFLDADRAAQIIGGAMFLLAPVAIIAQALTMDLARVRQDVERERQAGNATAVWKREMETRRQEVELAQRRELELERARLNAQVRIERIKAQTQPVPNPAMLASVAGMPALAAHVCQHCEREFSTVQALNAHRRFCAGIEPALIGTNGHGDTHD